MSIGAWIVEGEIGPGQTERPAEGVAAAAGAVLEFEGRVRGLEGDQPIDGLTYEVYEGMAERELERLAREVAARHGLIALRVWHSRGFVAVGGCSLRVRAESAHRGEALAAMAEFIAAIKRDVPIWKRPVWKG